MSDQHDASSWPRRSNWSINLTPARSCSSSTLVRSSLGSTVNCGRRCFRCSATASCSVRRVLSIAARSCREPGFRYVSTARSKAPMASDSVRARCARGSSSSCTRAAFWVASRVLRCTNTLPVRQTTMIAIRPSASQAPSDKRWLRAGGTTVVPGAGGCADGRSVRVTVSIRCDEPYWLQDHVRTGLSVLRRRSQRMPYDHRVMTIGATHCRMCAPSGRTKPGHGSQS